MAIVKKLTLAQTIATRFAPAANDSLLELVVIAFVVSCGPTSRAQARGTNQREPRSGIPKTFGTCRLYAIPRRIALYALCAVHKMVQWTHGLPAHSVPQSGTFGSTLQSHTLFAIPRIAQMPAAICEAASSLAIHSLTDGCSKFVYANIRCLCPCSRKSKR